MTGNVVDQSTSSSFVQDFLESTDEQILRHAQRERLYLIEHSRLSVIIVVIGFMTSSHAGFERGVFEMGRCTGHIGTMERISIVIRSTAVVIAGLHRPVALIRADTRLRVSFRIVHGNLQEVRSQPMQMRVGIGEQSTLERAVSTALVRIKGVMRT